MLYINELLSQIHNNLTNSVKLRSKIKGVYLYLSQEAISPFILINLQEIKHVVGDGAWTFKKSYNMKTSISLFIKQKMQAENIDIVEIIDKELSTSSFKLNGYDVSGIRKENMLLHHSNDLLTTKFENNYLILIKEQ